MLQEREIVRVGGTKPINIDVRIIAATNANLEEAITNGKFRNDLYYRLNVFPIKIPPLRSRKGDIYSLAIFFIKKFNQQYGRNIKDISPKAVQILKEYDWPGNVRELENIIGRAIINMKINEMVILESHLPQFEKHVEKPFVSDFAEEIPASVTNLEEAVEITEKRFILKVLKDYEFNKTKAAKELGISLRSLYYKMEKYGIEE